MTDVDALVRLPIEHSGTPIEMASATAIFETICGEALTIEVFTRATRCLTAQEYQLLTPSDATIGHERRGLLRTGTGVPAAETTAVVLTQRVPGEARGVLGMSLTGAQLPVRNSVPLGKALQGLGVTWELLEARNTPARSDASGEEQVIYLAVRLWRTAVPMGLVRQRATRCSAGAEFFTRAPGEQERAARRRT